MQSENMRDRLSAEITRKQFLQFMGGALLMVFGLDNLISLLTGQKIEKHIYINGNAQAGHGFGSSKFGV